MGLPPQNLMIYSPAGHGKTAFLGTAVGDDRLSPMILLDFEGGVDSIWSKVRIVEVDRLGEDEPTINKVDVVKIKSWKDFQTVHDFLADGEHNYVSVALDSLSEMNYLNLQNTIDIAIIDDRKHDVDIAEQRDYLRSSQQMRKLIRAYRDLPMNCFFTALAVEIQDARTKQFQLRPSMVGKLVGEIPGLVTVLGYLAIVEADDSTYRCLFTQPTERFMAKDRSEGGKLSPAVRNPTLPMIFDLLDDQASLVEGEVTYSVAA